MAALRPKASPPFVCACPFVFFVFFVFVVCLVSVASGVSIVSFVSPLVGEVSRNTCGSGSGEMLNGTGRIGRENEE